VTTTQDRRAPGHPAAAAGGPDRTRAAPAHLGPVVSAGVVLLLWVAWLLVPEGVRLDLLGGSPTPTADAASGQEAAPADAPADAPAAAELTGPTRTGRTAGAVGGPVADPATGPAPAAPAPQVEEVLPDPAAPVEVPRAGDGTFTVAPGTGPQVGDGRLVRYTVEVEGGVPLDAAAVAVVVESVLEDPRSWTGEGEWALQRVDVDPDARIVVTTPDTTDLMCAPLQTRGEVSCRNGDNVVLNAVRWTQGATTWGDDVVGYRQYLVNHELGHYLGSGHVDCPAAGRPAPVMLQQTLGLQDCTANAWPYP